ncbi:MAG: DUF1573 domain-containing protein [Prevotellaceae bacterium]|nr:DUF1573 domain-containing protein [Prevotellaceae bacterium]
MITLSFTACKYNRATEAEKDIDKILAEWVGKTVLFSNSKAICIDSLNYISETGTAPKKYKVLLYTDSTGCTSCRLRLHMWKPYVEELKSEVDFLFYFQNKSEKELLSILANEQFIYPVYIDNNDELNRLNKFPDNIMYQCFLLDSDNKVIAVGNPVHNVKIMELYQQIITSEVSDKPLVTTVEQERAEMELKDLQTGKTSEAIFVLKNTGTNPLVIQQVESSCGCTVPEWEKQPVGIGKSTEIRVRITPEKKEYFNKAVIVHCNNEQGKIMLRIKGMINE